MSVTAALSVTDLTIRAAAIAALAIAALLLTGWRKPARAEPRSPRGVATPRSMLASRSIERRTHGIVVEHVDAPTYRRPGVVRRLLAVAGSAGIGVLTGVLLAIVAAFTVAFAVIWLTDLLQR